LSTKSNQLKLNPSKRVKNLVKRNKWKLLNLLLLISNNNLLNKRNLTPSNLKKLRLRNLQLKSSKIYWYRHKRKFLSLLLNLIKPSLRTRECWLISKKISKLKKTFFQNLVKKSKKLNKKEKNKTNCSQRVKKLRKKLKIDSKLLMRKLLLKRRLNESRKRKFMSLNWRRVLKTKTWLVRPTSWLPRLKNLRRLSNKMHRLNPNSRRIKMKSLNLMIRKRPKRIKLTKQIKNWTKLRKY